MIRHQQGKKVFGPGCRFSTRKNVDAGMTGISIVFRSIPRRMGNIATLGGLGRHSDNGKLLVDRRAKERLGPSLEISQYQSEKQFEGFAGFCAGFSYLQSDQGLVAARLSGGFYLVWHYRITQYNSVGSGGGGLRRSPLLPWNSLVSWSRIADSLLYTGFSVPLLDYLVKTLLLDRGFGITTATNPVLLYSVMGLANGIYISTHNIFRGLPRSAAVGNFFRSILAIPLAILLEFGDRPGAAADWSP